MHSVNLHTPGLFIMFGYAGAGKTYFARQFAQAIGGFHLSSDRIRMLLFDEPQFNKEENAVVFGVMEYIFEELIGSGISVVYDAQNNIRSQRKKLSNIAAANHSTSMVVWVQTDIDTSFERASQRDRRNPDDKYSYQVEREAFMRLKDEMSKPNEEEYAVLSGKHNFASQLKTMRRKLQQLGWLKRVGQDSSSSDTNNVRLGGRVDMDRRRITRTGE